MKIAIADDELILLTHLCKLVSELLPDAEISSFSSAKTLMESAEKNRYDIAFLDIRMPGMTGIELAKSLKESNKKINIIFVTGYDGYQGEAMDLFASGYIKKPATKEKIQAQLDNLRHPVLPEKKRIFARTFGNFTLFVDGNPVTFARAKSHEIIAYLIHSRGSVISKKELSCIIFDDGNYDANRISYMSKLCADIHQTLSDLNAEDLFNISSKGLSINPDLLDCDLFDYLSGSSSQYFGEYMNQYSWAEEFKPMLK